MLVSFVIIFNQAAGFCNLTNEEGSWQMWDKQIVCNKHILINKNVQRVSWVSQPSLCGALGADPFENALPNLCPISQAEATDPAKVYIGEPLARQMGTL